MNKTFCILPFVHIAADPDGSVKPCCTSFDKIKKENGKPYNLGHDSIEEIFNSPDYKDIRKKMIAGEEVSGCSECYQQEKHSGFSQRISWNEHLKTTETDKQVWNAIANNCRTEPTIRYIDLRLGNMCNLKCRSCQPLNSSQLTKEIQEITNKQILNYFSLTESDNNWYTTKQFKDNLEFISDDVFVVYMTGGEPTLIPENIEYLQSLVDNNRASEITVTLNTNLTNAKPEFLEMISKFKQVIVFASIDGLGDVQEYLRYPSNWQQIRKNLLAFAELPNVKIEVSPVIQIANIGKITEFFDHIIQLENDKINLYPIVLFNPDYLSIANLPKEYKEQCRNQIVTWLSNAAIQPEEFRFRMTQVLSLLEEPENPALLARFKESTKIFDTHRNVSLVSVNPQLAQAINYV
jgi:MoaA/NifB/PqqE/SkfB family radical SAM enzyme